MAMVEESKGRSIVLFPSPGMGHLVSMFELAKLFLAHDLRVTVLVLDPPNAPGSTASFIGRASASHPSIAFHCLPSIPLSTNYLYHESLHFELIRLSNPNVRSFLTTFSTPPSALVLDFFCVPTLDVASELRIPSYYFFTSNATCLAFLLHFPTIHDTVTENFRDLGSMPIDFPGSLPVPAHHMMLPLLDRRDDAYVRFLDISRRLTKAAGILINTYEWLEPRALSAIRGRANVPPVLPIGPLIRSASDDPDHACLKWLNLQPRGSVVFLCFGSMGRFSAEQLKEMATGLERSGKRFLWVVRSPPGEGGPTPDLEMLLPRGFLGRTSGRGLVVGPWAPQRAVPAPRGGGGLRDARGVELGAGGAVGGGAHGGVAAVRGAEDEPGAGGGGARRGGGGGGVRGGGGVGGGGGEGGEGADGGGGGEEGEREGDRGEGEGGRGNGGGRGVKEGAGGGGEGVERRRSDLWNVSNWYGGFVGDGKR